MMVAPLATASRWLAIEPPRRSSGGDGVTAGQAEYIETLASAGVAAAVDGVFLEVHDNPAQAKSDAQNALKLDLLEPLLRRLMAIDAIVKQPATVARTHG